MRIATVAVCTALGLATASAAQADPLPMDQIRIQAVTHTGSGCPQGSSAVVLATDGSNLTMAFDKFIASAGPGTPITENRKNCDVVVKLRMPQGWHVAADKIDYQGHVNLDPQVTGLMKTTVYTPRTAQQPTDFQSSWTGPVTDDFQVTDVVPDGATVFSTNPGDTVSLNVNTQMHVDNTKDRKGSGILTADTINGRTTLVLGLQWRRDQNRATPSSKAHFDW